MKEIAVIGGGWYGCHTALVLRSEGHEVTLFESRENILKETSGNFGVRLHVGPHYPRSEKTRKGCRSGYEEFLRTYPDLVVEHAYSIYALGERDANNEPPKVNLETFRQVANENKNSREINPQKWGYSELKGAFNIEEPSIIVGNLLREKLWGYLQKGGVKVICNFKVQKLDRINNKTHVFGENWSGIYDYAVNTTSYKTLLPPLEPALPFKLDIIYQPCLALVYEDRLSKDMSLPPFSFIVMDGWFPCIMPYIENKEDREATGNTYRKYIVTHGKYTIMGSYKTVEEANACLKKIDENFVKRHVQPQCEEQMERFWPLFNPGRRFKYVGWKGAVLAKIKTNREFRSAVTFSRKGVIYIIPGKVSNIFDAARETLSLINRQGVLQQGAYEYVRGGTLDEAVNEITEALNPKIRNTCSLQTYAEITAHLPKEAKTIAPESIQSSFSEPNTRFTPWLSRNNPDYYSGLFFSQSQESREIGSSDNSAIQIRRACL